MNSKIKSELTNLNSEVINHVDAKFGENRQVVEALLQSVQTNVIDCVLGNRVIADSLVSRMGDRVIDKIQELKPRPTLNPEFEHFEADDDGYPLVQTGAVGLGFVAPGSENLYTERRDLHAVKYGKIAIFGIQKSGNTWVHGLLAETFGLPYLFDISKTKTVGVLSTHLPCGPRTVMRNDIVHSVCLVRDIRSIVVSFYHYLQSESYQRDIPYAKYSDWETFYYDWFLSRVVPSLRMETYCDEYAQHGVPILRYERLLNNTKQELVRLFQRWNQSFDEVALDQAIESNSFQNLKASGKMMGDVFIETSHFRKGGRGDFREELPKKILDDINSRFECALLRWGYDI